MGQRTRWRMVGVAAVVGGVMALGIYSDGQRKVVGKGVWEIGAGQAKAYEMVAQRGTRLRAEVVAMEDRGGAGGETGGRDWGVFMVDEENYKRWKMPEKEEREVSKLAEAEGRGRVVLGPVGVGAGKYYLVAENRGRQGVRVRWEVVEE